MTERKAEFRPADADDAPFRLTGARRVTTVEGRLARGALVSPLFVLTSYVLLFSVAEGSTLLFPPWVGMALHAFVLFTLITHASLIRRVHPPLARILVATAPAALIRIVSIASPLAQFSYVQWFTIIAVILYAGIVTSLRILKPEPATIGLRFPAAKHIPLELGIILLGFGFGWLEYQILKPGALVGSFTFRNLAAPILVLYLSTGLLEELLFRGTMQRYAGEALGTWKGIAYVTLLFAVLHTGWHSWLDILFVGLVGLVYSLVVHRTKSLLGVSISHGITNTMLFLVMPTLNA